MSGKAFIDTNVLAYAADQSEPGKRKVARDLIRRLAQEGTPCISTQVAQEFFATVTRKMGVTPLAARDLVLALKGFEHVVVDFEDIQAAIDGHILWRIAFWDALIVTAARKAQCAVLYTEDLNDGQTFGGVRVVNPFRV
jgi:predicted nucleic acid-binding protein